MNKNELSRPKRVDQIDKQGFNETVTANADECMALAQRFDCEKIENLVAKIHVRPKADKMTYHVTGTFAADVTQACIISDKPIQTHLNEDFEAWYRDVSTVTPFRQKPADNISEQDEHEIRPEEEDPEIINDGVLDLGEVTAQFLGLAINPYPKAEDVDNGDHIESTDEDKPNPFAKLAALKTKE